MTWCSPISPGRKMSCLQNSKVKTLLIAFVDNKGIIHKKFVSAGQTFNVAFYQAVLSRLLQLIRCVRPELHITRKWMLLHDNAPEYSAIRVRQFLAHEMEAVLDRRHYFLDLAPRIFPVSPLEGCHQRCTFCGSDCHQRSCDRFAINSKGGPS